MGKISITFLQVVVASKWRTEWILSLRKSSMILFIVLRGKNESFFFRGFPFEKSFLDCQFRSDGGHPPGPILASRMSNTFFHLNFYSRGRRWVRTSRIQMASCLNVQFGWLSDAGDEMLRIVEIVRMRFQCWTYFFSDLWIRGSSDTDKHETIDA